MSEEIHPFDEAHDIPPVFFMPVEQTRPGLVNRMKALFPFLAKPEVAQQQLHGRVQHGMQQNAYKTVEQLRILRQEVKGKWQNDSSLWSSFEAVVRPLLREYEQLERRLQKPDLSPHVFVSLMKNYNEWLAKAKDWATLATRPHDKAKIEEAVVEHTQHVSDSIIDRDLQMLDEYLAHELSALGMDRPTIERVGRKIHRDISIHINSLAALKQHKSKDLDLAGLLDWKGRINAQRADHYHAALHVIDENLQSMNPQRNHLPPTQDL